MFLVSLLKRDLGIIFEVTNELTKQDVKHLDSVLKFDDED